MTARPILMIDVDGVIVHGPPGGWAANLEADLGVSRATLQAHFFQPHWRDVALGRATLHERLAPMLAEHAPAVSADAVINYWFAKDASLDMAVLDDLATARSQGWAMRLATIQEHERAAYLWNDLGLKDRFDAIDYAADIGATKSEPAFYRAVETRTGRPPEGHLLIDDTAANIEAARAAGWKAELWDGQCAISALISRHDIGFP
jgi:putative hydrolase of the HAD superfamily